MPELRDLRAKITVETDAVLDAISRVTGQDRSEIVRDWLHKLAKEHIAIGNVIRTRLNAEGLAGNDVVEPRSKRTAHKEG